MTFRLANVDGRASLVDDDGSFHDLESASGGRLGPDPLAALASPDVLHAVGAALAPASAVGSFADAREAQRVGAPVPRPRSCFAVGLNYPAHAAEANVAPPANPLVFTKFPSCLTGPDADIDLGCATADWEVELVVVIGRGGRGIPRSDAWAHVAGLTVGQDISDRALQFSAVPPHFDLGKSRDTYGPTGPVVVSTDLVATPDDLALSCSVNDAVRQEDRTSSMIFDVPFLVSYLSDILTLHPGDLLFTGTPNGVGMASGSTLAPGDVITSTIEGIGTMVNRCR